MQNAEAVLGSDLISAAKIEQRQSKEQTESHPSDYDEFDIAKAEFILQRLDTHQDRDRFMRISMPVRHKAIDCLAHGPTGQHRPTMARVKTRIGFKRPSGSTA